MDFCMLFDAIPFGVSIFSCFNLCFNFHQKYVIFARFLMQLPSACPLFRACIYALLSTKNHRFLHAFWCNYLRRVDFFVLQFMLQFSPKIYDFWTVFDAITFRVSIFSRLHLCFTFDQKSSIFCTLFDAITFGVSIFFDIQFMLQFRTKVIDFRMQIDGRSRRCGSSVKRSSPLLVTPYLQHHRMSARTKLQPEQTYQEAMLGWRFP